MSLRGVRGATVVTADEKEQVIAETEILLQEMLDKNNIHPDDIASIFFSVTPDITSEFPAVAARKLGIYDAALLCLNEIPIDGSLPFCIRILIHVNSNLNQADMKHIYLKAAESLRPDHVKKHD